MSRRRKIAVLTRGVIKDMVLHALRGRHELPADLSVVNMYHDDWTDDWLVHVASETFEEVEEATIPPVIQHTERYRDRVAFRWDAMACPSSFTHASFYHAVAQIRETLPSVNHFHIRVRPENLPVAWSVAAEYQKISPYGVSYESTEEVPTDPDLLTGWEVIGYADRPGERRIAPLLRDGRDLFNTAARNNEGWEADPDNSLTVARLEQAITTFLNIRDGKNPDGTPRKKVWEPHKPPSNGLFPPAFQITDEFGEYLPDFDLPPAFHDAIAERTAEIVSTEKGRNYFKELAEDDDEVDPQVQEILDKVSAGTHELVPCPGVLGSFLVRAVEPRPAHLTRGGAALPPISEPLRGKVLEWMNEIKPSPSFYERYTRPGPGPFTPEIDIAWPTREVMERTTPPASQNKRFAGKSIGEILDDIEAKEKEKAFVAPPGPRHPFWNEDFFPMPSPPVDLEFKVEYVMKEYTLPIQVREEKAASCPCLRPGGDAIECYETHFPEATGMTPYQIKEAGGPCDCQCHKSTRSDGGNP